MVKRYEPELSDYCGDMDCCPPYVTMEEHDNGDYVTWEDYSRLLLELAGLEQDNHILRGALSIARNEVSRYQYPNTTGS